MTEGPETAVAVHVTGEVQGVWFRAWTQERAGELGLRGWVKNEPDGSVRALFAGPEEAVSEMVAALGRGPSRARVAHVAKEPADPGDVPQGFRVLR